MENAILKLSYQLFTDLWCPSGWRENNGFCYYTSIKFKPHSEARAECIRLSANLISITSPEETQFIER